MIRECEYCGNEYDDEIQGDGDYQHLEYCSCRCERADNAYRNAEAQADAKFEEMAY
jgi:hypothetical protein